MISGMLHYTKDPKRDHSFDNHPYSLIKGYQALWVPGAEAISPNTCLIWPRVPFKGALRDRSPGLGPGALRGSRLGGTTRAGRTLACVRWSLSASTCLK